MDIYRLASHAYATVNLAGRLNDAVLDPDRIRIHDIVSRVNRARQRALQNRVGQGPERQVTLTHRARSLVRGARAAAVDCGANVRQICGIGLASARSTPIGLIADPAFTVFMPRMTKFYPGLYPIAELLVGRGHSNDHGFQSSENFPLGPANPLGRLHNRYSHHGLVGFLLEATPLHLGQKFYGAGYQTCGAACVLGAAIGRLVLQPFRLAVASIAFAAEYSNAVFYEATTVSVEIGLRLARQGLVTVCTASGLEFRNTNQALDQAIAFFTFLRENPFEFAQMYLATTPQMDQDDGSRGANDRVERIANRALQRFGEIELREADADGNADPREMIQVRALAEEIAAELRHYCQNLPTNEALRGGLARIKAFLDITYDEDVIDFHPPELEEVGTGGGD